MISLIADIIGLICAIASGIVGIVFFYHYRFIEGLLAVILMMIVVNFVIKN